MPRGSIKWAVWLALIAATFAGMEAWSLVHGTSTLSRFVWNITEAFKPFAFLAGFLNGFLVCHFWWGGVIPFSKPDVKEE